MKAKFPIRKILLKTISFIIVAVIISLVAQSFLPVLTNDIAMGQMENDSAAYIEWELYNQITHRIIPLVYSGVILIYIVSVIIDIYKFYKGSELN